MRKCSPKSFQELIFALQTYWYKCGCAIIQPIDIEVGAGTSHPITFLRAIGPEPISAAYVQASRRPTDGRYGRHPNRLQHYYQFQVIMKPSPDNFQEIYIQSLKSIGIDLTIHSIQFIEDNWENPTLGAWGLGWEVWLNGIEITQFTYFQQMGSLDCYPITGEISYGLERLAMHLQEVENVFDLIWSKTISGILTYKDLFLQSEKEQSNYNFKYSDVQFLFASFNQCEKEIYKLLELKQPLSAYEKAIQATHIFNLLDARKAISKIDKKYYIIKIRSLTKSIAQAYYAFRKKLGFPMCIDKENKRKYD